MENSPQKIVISKTTTIYQPPKSKICQSGLLVVNGRLHAQVRDYVAASVSHVTTLPA